MPSILCIPCSISFSTVSYTERNKEISVPYSKYVLSEYRIPYGNAERERRAGRTASPHEAKYRKAQSEPDFREEETDEEESAFLRKGERLMKNFTDTVRLLLPLRSSDIVSFENALLNSEQEKPANLKKRDEANFAKAYTGFFSDRMYFSQPSRNMEGLKNAVTLARRMYFGRLMDFLMTDLPEV